MVYLHYKAPQTPVKGRAGYTAPSTTCRKASRAGSGVSSLRQAKASCRRAVTFAALPFHFRQADGAPVRAVAWVD